MLLLLLGTATGASLQLLEFLRRGGTIGTENVPACGVTGHPGLLAAQTLTRALPHWLAPVTRTETPPQHFRALPSPWLWVESCRSRCLCHLLLAFRCPAFCAMLRLVAALFCLALLGRLAAGHSTAGGVVMIESAAQFEDSTKSGDWLLFFGTNWCKHCQSLMPHFQEAAEQSRPLSVRFAKIDCDSQRSLCDRFDVNGYPTLYFYRNGMKTSYEGARTTEALVQFVSKLQEPAVHVTTTAELLTSAVRGAPSQTQVAFVLVGSSGPAAAVFQSVAETLQAMPLLFIAAPSDAVVQSSVLGQGNKRLERALASTSTRPLVLAFSLTNVEDLSLYADWSVLESQAPSAAQGGLLSWVQDHELPTVAPMNMVSFASIRRRDKIAVLLATAKPVPDPHLLQTFRRVAAASRGSGANRLQFLHVDITEYAPWAENVLGIHGEKDTPCVVAFDVAEGRRWSLPGRWLIDEDGSSSPAQQQLSQFAQDVAADRLTAVYVGQGTRSNKGFWGYVTHLVRSLNRFVQDHPILALLSAVSVMGLLGVLVWLCMAGPEPTAVRPSVLPKTPVVGAGARDSSSGDDSDEDGRTIAAGPKMPLDKKNE